ncbi:MAG: type IV toxin-antitoxin system AbiEi family antitoxin domain-containing protein [Gammaproteobacteria bacterium]
MHRKAVDPIRRKLPAVFTYSEARTAGLSAERLYAWRDQGIVNQVGRGLYRWADADAGEVDQDLFEVAHRAPRGTLCLVTALARHGLTDTIPPRVDIAIPRGSRIPALRETVSVHVFARDTFEVGREELVIGKNLSIAIYSEVRTLVDVIRLRHREGPDVAWQALRRWLTRRGSQPAALLSMARRFHGAETAVRDALQIVL